MLKEEGRVVDSAIEGSEEGPGYEAILTMF
jgi:hypothetical protein